MSLGFFNAAQRLADVLEQENDALKRLDFPSAAALLTAKDSALADLAGQPKPPATPPLLATLMRQVSALAAENQELLERALAVQTRIIRIIARACVPPSMAPQYHAQGGRSPMHRTAALAVSTRV